MKKIGIFLIGFLMTTFVFSQEEAAKKLLDEVASKMGAYKNMTIVFSQSLINKEAGILEGDEAPIRGTISIQGEKYNLNYLGNVFIFDGNKLYVINNDDKEISINDGDLDEDSGFIYPSKLLTFYKEGYNFKMGKPENLDGRKIQYIILNPINSNSEITYVELAIDLKTKHIYKLIQTGENGTQTTFTITGFKSNQPILDTFFSFNEEKYKSQNYIID